MAGQTEPAAPRKLRGIPRPETQALQELTRFVQAGMHDTREIWELAGMPEERWHSLYLHGAVMDGVLEKALETEEPGRARMNRPLWRAWLLMIAMDLPSMSRLARTLAERPGLVELCGLEKPPSEMDLSRFSRRMGRNIRAVETCLSPVVNVRRQKMIPEDLLDIHRALEGIILILELCRDGLAGGEPANPALGPKLRELSRRAQSTGPEVRAEPERPDDLREAVVLAGIAQKLAESGNPMPARGSAELDARLRAVAKRLFPGEGEGK